MHGPTRQRCHSALAAHRVCGRGGGLLLLTQEARRRLEGQLLELVQAGRLHRLVQVLNVWPLLLAAAAAPAAPAAAATATTRVHSHLGGRQRRRDVRLVVPPEGRGSALLSVQVQGVPVLLERRPRRRASAAFARRP